MLMNIYLKSIKKWKDILSHINGNGDISYIYWEIFSPCSFCRGHEGCDNCLLPKYICADNGHDGLVGELHGAELNLNRRDYKKVTKKVIKALENELKKLSD